MSDSRQSIDNSGRIREVAIGCEWWGAGPEWIEMMDVACEGEVVDAPDCAGCMWFFCKFNSVESGYTGYAKRHFIRQNVDGLCFDVACVVHMATGMLKIESVTELDSEWMPTCLPFVPWYMHQGLNWAFRAWQIVDSSLQGDWLAANSVVVRQRFRFMQAEGGSEADVTMGGPTEIGRVSPRAGTIHSANLAALTNNFSSDSEESAGWLS